MNLNANKTCENFEIDDSKQVYDFYMGFINHTFSNMPIGFVESSKTVSECVDTFFKKNPVENTSIKKVNSSDDWSNAFKF
jgi:hypothetical protein